MNQETAFEVKVSSTGIQVDSTKLSELIAGGAADWGVSQIGSRRFMFCPTEDQKSMAGSEQGIASSSIDIFADLLSGLIRRRWSGVISVDTGYGVKKIFFKDGELCFASSNVIDDRLGEVVYRDGMISLDQMVSAAVKVDRHTKFGQVLLQSQEFSAVELWQALQLQVQEIVRSVFLVEQVYYEMKMGGGLAPTEVVFARGTEELLEECLAYGKMYKAFSSTLTDETPIFVDDDAMSKILRPGTFLHDFLVLARDSNNLKGLLESSKLRSISTKAALMNAANLGLCVIKQEQVFDFINPIENLGALRSKIDTYEVILKRAKDAFLQDQKEFPISALKGFADSCNPLGFHSLILDQEGQIGKNSLQNIYSQCENNFKRSRFFEIRIESLTQFLLQLSGDLLSSEAGRDVRQAYRNLIS